MGVTDGGAVVLQSNVPGATGQYYNTFLYSGSTGAYTNITSQFAGSTYVVSVNDNGEVSLTASGTTLKNGYTSPGFLISSFANYAAATPLPATTGGLTLQYALGIDTAGEIVGGAAQANGFDLPFVYTGGSSYALPVPNIASSEQYGGSAIAISPNGNYAVGTWNYTAGPPNVPFGAAGYWTRNGGSWANTPAFTDLSGGAWGNSGPEGFLPSIALAVDNAGAVVCATTTTTDWGVNGDTASYLFQIGLNPAQTTSYTSLGSLRFAYPKADTLIDGGGGFQNCINQSGQVVGYEVVGGVNHAALWQNGSLLDLQTYFTGALPTGFVLNNATAISDNGYIGGYGTDASGNANQAVRLQLLPGDANLDGKVDINDLTIVLSHYNQTTGAAWATGDFNGDGKVDINDLTIVLSNYNQSVGSSAADARWAAVPEPGTLGLLLATALLAAIGRARSQSRYVRPPQL